MTQQRALGVVAVVHNAAPDAPDRDDEPPSCSADAEVVEVAELITETLSRMGVSATRRCVTGDPARFVRQLRADGVTRVFNLVEALDEDASREAEFATLLEQAQLPFTGSPSSALGLAFNKDRARRLMAAFRIPHADGFAVHTLEEAQRAPALALPLFIKPACADGSIGIDAGSVVRTLDAYHERVRWLLARTRGGCLVERYLPGPELNVACFPGERGLMFHATAIDFSGYPDDIPPIVTYDCKWTPESPEYVARSVDARELVDGATVDAAIRVARAALLTLGASGYGRVDLRVDAEGAPRVIDLNPNPDLHPEAGLALAAQMAGVSYEALLWRVAASASCPSTWRHQSYHERELLHPSRVRRRSRAARLLVASH